MKILYKSKFCFNFFLVWSFIVSAMHEKIFNSKELVYDRPELIWITMPKQPIDCFEIIDFIIINVFFSFSKIRAETFKVLKKLSLCKQNA